MKNFKNNFIIIIVIIGFYFLIQKRTPNPLKKTIRIESLKSENNHTYEVVKPHSSAPKELALNSKEISEQREALDHSTKEKQIVNEPNKHSPPNEVSNDSDKTLTYTIDDGLAVVQSDIVIGKISSNTLLTQFSGPTKEPTIQLWPTTEIPFYIQPNLHNPERIARALAYFSNTNIHLIPYTNQEDSIVFEQGQGSCKSYLGRIGGHQPLWISNGCSEIEIAHEVMHSLGFIHEQNRIDRDENINVFVENIDPKFVINFEKFSNPSMIVSGLSSFDFESIMIYPELMFSINGLPTIRSKIKEQVVFPSERLSLKDVERINKAYLK